MIKFAVLDMVIFQCCCGHKVQVIRQFVEGEFLVDFQGLLNFLKKGQSEVTV